MIKFYDKCFTVNKSDKIEIHNICGKYRVWVNEEEIPEYRVRDYIKTLIKHCIDLDEWKNSWHMNYGSYLYDEKMLAELIKILDDKVKDRKCEMELLEKCKIIMLDTIIKDND